MVPKFSLNSPDKQSNGLTLRLMEEEIEFASVRQQTIRLHQQAQVYKTRPLYTNAKKRIERPGDYAPAHLKPLPRSGASSVRAPPLSA